MRHARPCRTVLPCLAGWTSPPCSLGAADAPKQWLRAERVSVSGTSRGYGAGCEISAGQVVCVEMYPLSSGDSQPATSISSRCRRRASSTLIGS